jgi:signal peptidase II
MTKRLALILIGCFILSLIFDQVSKHYCIEFLQGTSIGPFNFLEVHNKGFVLGSFSDLHPILRIVCVSALYGFIFLIFILIQYFLIARLITLRLGTTLLMSGISGNSLDRIFTGSVIDFVSVLQPIYFNLADIFQIIGSVLIIYSVFHDREEIWHPDCLRSNYLIKNSSQLRFAFKFSAIGIVLAFILGLFSISFLSLLSIERTKVIAFIAGYVAITSIYGLISFYVGLLISHRSIGAVYAFERFIEDILQGRNRKFKLRKADNFKHLEDIAEKIRIKILKG